MCGQQKHITYDVKHKINFQKNARAFLNKPTKSPIKISSVFAERFHLNTKHTSLTFFTVVFSGNFVTMKAQFFIRTK